MDLPLGFQKSFARVDEPPSAINRLLPVRPIAFYLPQFHPIEINDRNWGKGFTEWKNVVRGAPEFQGHYQPRMPADLGFYDLRLKEVQVRQSKHAEDAGLAALCYYYYWFDGEQPMLLPLENHVENQEISLKFCLCFANENWTKTWDGLEKEVILRQSYRKGFEERFWQDIVRFLKSGKYLLDSEGKPILLIYKPNLIPNFKGVADNLRRLAAKAGFAGLNLIGNMAFSIGAIGLDGVYEFPPLASGTCAERELSGSLPKTYVHGRLPSSASQFYDYRQFVMRERMVKATPGHVYPGVMPSWDNTARRPSRGSVLADSSPDLFSDWVEMAARRAAKTSEKLLFINAWNEWAEGAYLEPDERFGWAYLEALRKGLLAVEKAPVSEQICVFVHVFYPDVWSEIAEHLAARVREPFYLVVTTPLELAIEPPVSDFLKGFEVLRYENKGRDILPFLRALRDTKFNFDIGLKLHTKRSPHRLDGEDWRKFLLGALVPDRSTASITELFRSDPNLGFLAPEGHWAPLSDLIGSNHELILRLMEACKIDTSDNDLETGRLIAGSMFWFRRQALASISCESVIDLFTDENGQVDGTAAHAAERLFGLLGEKRGYFVATTDQVQDLVSQTKRSRWIGTRLSLLSDQTLSSSFIEKVALKAIHRKGSAGDVPTPAGLRRSIERLALSNHSAILLYRKLPVGFRLWLRHATGRSQM